MENIKEKFDYLEYFSNVIEFNNEELEAELNDQINHLKSKNPIEGRAYEAEIKDERSRWLAKEALMHAALMYSGIIAVQDDDSWREYSKQLLEKSENSTKLGILIRMNCFMDEEAAQAMRHSIEESLRSMGMDVSKESVSMAEKKFDLRLARFIDLFKKKHNL
jgi:hypothetical protein